MPKVAKVACIVAFVIAGLAVVAAVMGQIFLLAGAVIPLIAGIGILRKRVWSAYGYALFQFAQLLVAVYLLLRAEARPLDVIGGAVFMAILIPLYLFAGRALASAGGQRGWALPWIAISALLSVPILFVQAFVMPSASMENTLLIGDHMLVQHFPRHTPTRGDLMVFQYPVDRREVYLKRVIGIPGDHIKIVNKVVYRNGAPLNESYALHKTEYMDSYRDNFPSEPNGPYANAARDMLQNHVVNGEVVVPERSYFVLGDNRDDSLDSRYWGFVTSADLIGKPLLIYDSETEEPHHIRWNRIFKRL